MKECIYMWHIPVPLCHVPGIRPSSWG